MPKQVKDALSAVTVRQIRTPGRYADGNGLYLVVTDPAHGCGNGAAPYGGAAASWAWGASPSFR